MYLVLCMCDSPANVNESMQRRKTEQFLEPRCDRTTSVAHTDQSLTNNELLPQWLYYPQKPWHSARAWTSHPDGLCWIKHLNWRRWERWWTVSYFILLYGSYSTQGTVAAFHQHLLISCMISWHEVFCWLFQQCSFLFCNSEQTLEGISDHSISSISL